MGRRIPRDEAYVIAFWLASLLFGAHIVVYILYLWVCRQRPSGAPLLMSITAAAMLFVGAIQNFVGLQRVLEAFWGDSGLTPAQYLNLTNITSNYVESVTWITQVFLGDSFLTYRCWVLYGKRWWALVPPAVLVLADFAIGMVLQWEYGRDHSGETNAEAAAELLRWEGSMLGLTVIVNLGLTIAIAARIIYQHRQTPPTLRHNMTESRHVRIMWIIVESGVIIAITQLLVLVLGALDNPGYQILVHAVCPMIGIVFTGVIVRVQLSTYSSQFTSDISSAPLDTIVLHSSVNTRLHESLAQQHISFDAKTMGQESDTVDVFKRRHGGGSDSVAGSSEAMELTALK
ncbi:hypothetical protein BXZ70DRAFT_272660 [Cristinia sonorae]|uniref:Uncharacterized protein n=1 Tax=Cristinia sonorae TaxID=1940300 RepID=A0A8K0XUC1_9AGAR|nr:hypothetical protein BXZ70DRAFT_272660 [Cristinia sonorae]